MKNLKKISRNQLKQVKGGDSTPVCGPGLYYVCEAVGQCDEISGVEDCLCACKPRVLPTT